MSKTKQTTYRLVGSGFATSRVSSGAAALDRALAARWVDGHAVARAGAWGWRTQRRGHKVHLEPCLGLFHCQRVSSTVKSYLRGRIALRSEVVQATRQRLQDRPPRDLVDSTLLSAKSVVNKKQPTCTAFFARGVLDPNCNRCWRNAFGKERGNCETPRALRATWMLACAIIFLASMMKMVVENNRKQRTTTK